jgi:hypothetical protein
MAFTETSVISEHPFNIITVKILHGMATDMTPSSSIFVHPVADRYVS